MNRAPGLLIALFACRLCHAAVSPSLPRTSISRYMWVWTIAPVADLKAQQDFFSFCEAKRIKGVYFTTGPIVRSKEPLDAQLEAFLRRAHERGLMVFALSGDPHFSLATHHAGVLKRLGWALAVGGDDRAAQFDGVEFDIEPHVLDEFDAERESVLVEHLDLVVELRARVREARPDFVLGFSVPFWFDSQSPHKSMVRWRGETLPVAFHMLKLLNGLPPGQGRIVIAAYRDRADGPNGSIRHSRDEIEFAAKHAPNVRIVVGLETKDVQGHPRITFWQEGEAALERAIAAIVEAFGRQEVFAGLAVHHYTTYRALRP